MISLFEYLKLVLLNPRKLIFLNEGLGIEARYVRCKNFWDKHLQLSKNFIEESLKDSHYNSIAVLGAGSLLDIDLSELAKKTKEIHLFDANPKAKNNWPKSINNIKIHHHIKDITESFDEVRNIKNLNNFKSKIPVLGEFDVVISLNILSQFHVLLNTLLSKRFSTDEIKNISKIIEHSHIEALKNSAKKKIILLYDTEFFFYTQETSEWQVESALSQDISKFLSSYKLEHKSSWFWHVAPQGIENIEYGEIHDVCAQCYNKLS